MNFLNCFLLLKHQYLIQFIQFQINLLHLILLRFMVLLIIMKYNEVILQSILLMFFHNILNMIIKLMNHVRNMLNLKEYYVLLQDLKHIFILILISLLLRLIQFSLLINWIIIQHMKKRYIINIRLILIFNFNDEQLKLFHFQI